MALRSIAKKVFRMLARVIPQCGMVSQAVAFNMFLAFFPSLLVALGLMSNSLRGKNGPELVVRLSAILHPGSWQLVSEFLTSREVNPLELGGRRLGRDVGRRLTGDEAHHGRHPLNLL
jgi:membrane protein